MLVGAQLRNLVWAASCNDVFLMHDNCLKHWSGLARPPKNQLSHVRAQQGHGKRAQVQGSRLSTCSESQRSACRVIVYGSPWLPQAWALQHSCSGLCGRQLRLDEAVHRRAVLTLQ